MFATEQIETDVLIIGAGLAGMRAAISVLETRYGLSLIIVSERRGPCGSSFVNLHNQVGMQVCISDKDRDDFFKEAVAIAPPGYINPELVKIMTNPRVMFAVHFC